jgi:hypothetical protein
MAIGKRASSSAACAVAAHACRRDLAVALLLYLEAWKDLRSSDFEKLIRPTGCWSDGE